MNDLKIEFRALTKTFKEWEEIYDRVQIIDEYIKHRSPKIIKMNIQYIEKLIELDTRLDEELKLIRKNIHNYKNKKYWEKIRNTHFKKLKKESKT